MCGDRGGRMTPTARYWRIVKQDLRNPPIPSAFPSRNESITAADFRAKQRADLGADDGMDFSLGVK